MNDSARVFARLAAGLLVVTGILVAAPAVAGVTLPRVRFASSQIQHREMYTQVAVKFVVEERNGAPLTFEMLAEAGTATAGVDFVEGYSTAHLSADDTLQAFVRIYQDTDPEPPETIHLSIPADGEMYELVHPSTATLTIVDDDLLSPAAHFETAEDIPLDPWGRIAVAVEPGVATEIDVVVDDLPPEGATIHYTSTVDGQIHTLEFSGTARQTIMIPAEAVPAGEVHVLTELQILNPPAGKATTAIHYVRAAFAYETLTPEEQECSVCVATSVAHVLRLIQALASDCLGVPGLAQGGAGVPVLASLPDYSDDVTLLRRYRDEVLMATPGGAYHAQLYRDHSPALGLAILQRPTLIHRVFATWDLWVPAVAAVVDGQGGAFVITQDMQNALLGLMGEFEEVGSPEVGTLMQDFRAALDLANVAGRTASELQQAIESSAMEVEKTSWGGVKALYR